MNDFADDGWFARLPAVADQDPETFERLGFAELRLLFEVIDGDDIRRFGLVLDGYDVDYAGEIADVDAFAADTIVTGPIDAWSEMAANIAAHGGADKEHTLNCLTMAGVPLSVTAPDPMGRDKFFRYAETLQALFDGTAPEPAVA